MPGRVLLLLFLGAAAFPLAGCGGSASSSTADIGALAKGHLTKAEFINRADGICRRTREEQQDLKRELEDSSRSARSSEDLRKLAPLVREINDGTRRDLAHLHQLEPPPEDRESVRAMLAAVDSQVILTVSYAEALETGDVAKIESLAKPILADAENVEGMAQGFGLKVCGIDESQG